MFSRWSVEGIVKIIGLQLNGVGDVIITGNIVPCLLPLISPGENLCGQIRTELSPRDSVLDLEPGAENIALASGLRGPSVLVTLPYGDFQATLLKGRRKISHRLVGQPGRFPDKIVGDIEFKPRQKLPSDRRPSVPALEPLVLVVVMFKIEGGEKRTIPEVTVDLEELPAAESVILGLLPLRRGSDRQ